MARSKKDILLLFRPVALVRLRAALVDDNCGGVSSASEAARVNFLFLEEKEKLTPSSAVPLAAAADAEDDAREEGAADDDEPTESENEGDGGTAKEEQVLRRSAETSAALSG